MKQTTAIASLLLLAISGVSASPVEAAPLEKRSGETLYLANCEYLDSVGRHEYWSEIQYYADGSQSQNGQIPSINNRCALTGQGQGYVAWEGQPLTCNFPSNVFFTSNIQSGAQSRPDFSYAGSGKNNYRNFNCYKDNKRQLWIDNSTPEAARRCNSIYYCLDA